MSANDPTNAPPGNDPNAGPAKGQDSELLRSLVASHQQLIELKVLEQQQLKSSERWARLKAFAFMVPVLIGVGFYVFRLATAWESVTGQHVAVVRITGEVAEGKPASGAKVNPLLNKAFANRYSTGLIIEMNSPGGSPAQAMIIHDNLLRLRKEHPEKKVYVVAEDLDASAAYLISVAADEIWVQKSSLVGSIGVRWDNWGVKPELLEKIMVERRSHHAGKNKNRFDPFEPVKAEDNEKLDGLMATLHQDFIEIVKQGRGDRLKINDDTFTGDFWLGQQAVDMGLADGIGATDALMRSKFKGINIRKEYAASQFGDLFKHLGASMGSSLGGSIAAGALEAVQGASTPSYE